MENLHKIQMLILRELLFKPNSRFTDLNIEGLGSDHFSYHINKLLELKLVSKDSQKYSLTTTGKEFANRMDTDDIVIEKQPKVAVMVVGVKYEGDTKYVLIQERTKEPYYGYKGFITGKIRFGEKVLQAAQRELKEETNLDCTELSIKSIIRDHVHIQESGELVEDKIFFIIEALDPQGEIVNTESGKNSWVTEKDFYKMDKLYYNEITNYELSKQNGLVGYEESTYLIEDF